MFVVHQDYEVRDPIHRSIFFDREENRFISHPLFQRLRSISQLGFVSLAYPGAIHTRFLHSLGVMHIAGNMFQHLFLAGHGCFAGVFKSDDLRYFYRITRLAALLHDIGHAPFSHTLESQMPLLRDLKIPTDWREGDMRQARHEDYTVALIYHFFHDRDHMLSRDEAQDICAIIHGEIRPSGGFNEIYGQSGVMSVLKNIVSGEVDADRMDYLLRDSYFAGVSYGHFDLDRLMNALVLVEKNGGKIAIDQNAIYTFEDFLLARYHMFLQVYFHKTSLCFDYYLSQAIQEGEIEVSFGADLEAYILFTDDHVREAVRKNSSRFWSQKIFRRETSKLIKSCRIDDIEGSDRYNQLKVGLASAGCRSFEMRAKGYLSQVGKNHPSGDMLVRRRDFSGDWLEPIGTYSRLIERFNSSFDLRHLYCLEDDVKKARRALDESV